MATSPPAADSSRNKEQLQSPETERLYTAKELLTLSAGSADRYALMKGKLSVMSPAGSEHGVIASRINARLSVFAEDHQLGAVFAAETGFKLDSDPDTILAPDAAFVAAKRLPVPLPQGYFPGPPDLAVEVVSPNDRAADVQEKVQAWLHHGTQLVWVVEPKSQTISIYRPDGSATVLQSNATLEGDPVLPGFRYDVSRLFA